MGDGAGSSTSRAKIFWGLQKHLDGKTHNNQTEAKDKVRDSHRDTERALETMENLHERFERVSKDLVEEDQNFVQTYGELQDAMEKTKQAQRLVDIASQAVHDSRQDNLRLSTAFDEAASELHEDLGEKRTLTAKTAATTSAMSVETNDRSENELKYLQGALSLIHTMLNREAHEDTESVAVENTPSPPP